MAGAVDIDIKTKADKQSAEKTGQEVAGLISDKALEGLGNVDARLNAIGKGRAAIKVISELKKGLDGIGDKNVADSISAVVDRLAQTMGGELDAKGLKALKKETAELEKILKGLKSPWLEKIGPKIKETVSQVEAFRKSAKGLPDEMRRSFDFKGVLGEFGLRTTTISDNITNLTTKLPGLGKIGAGAFGAISLAISATIKAVQFFIAENRKVAEEMRKGEVAAVSTAQREAARVRDNAMWKIEHDKKVADSAVKNQRDALAAARELARAQEDLEAKRRSFGVRDETTLAKIGEDETRRQADRSYEDNRVEIDNAAADLERERADIERRQREIEEENRKLKENTKAAFAEKGVREEIVNPEDMLGRIKTGWRQFWGQEIDDETAQSQISELQGIIEANNAKRTENIRAMEENKARLEAIKAEEKNIEARRALADAEKAKSDQERRNAEEARQHAEKMARTEWENRAEDRAYNEEERDYQFRMANRRRAGAYQAEEYEARTRLTYHQENLDKNQAELNELMAAIAKRTGKSEMTLTDRDLTDEERARRERLLSFVERDKAAVQSAKGTLYDAQAARAARRAEFDEGINRQQNRLTAMGLGSGGVGADFGKETADNTRKLVELTRQLVDARKPLYDGTHRQFTNAWSM